MPDFAKQAQDMLEKKREAEIEERREAKRKAKEEAEKSPKDDKSEKKTDKVDKPDKKETPPVEDKKETTQEDDPNAEVPEDQLRVLPQDKPSTAKRINSFLRKEAALAKEVSDAKAEVDKLKKEGAAKANPEEMTNLKAEYQKAKDDLAQFRRRYSLESDTEFKSKYEEPVVRAEQAIEETLKKYQLGDATIKAIKDAGGFAAFSRSTQQFNVNQKNDKGEVESVTVSAAELARNWLAQIPVADAELIKQSVGRQQMLADEKKSATEKAVAEAKTYFEQQETMTKKQREEAESANKKIKEDYDKWVDETYKKSDWLKDRPVDDAADADTKKQAEEYNKLQAQLRNKLKSAPKDVVEYQEMAYDAAHAHFLRRETGELKSQLEAANAEITRLKEGMKTTNKSGSLMNRDSSKAPDKPKGEPGDFKTALRVGIRKMAGDDGEE